jgi:DNA-binding CsgD family transcriptional regulator
MRLSAAATVIRMNLLERESHLEALGSALERAREGHGCVALVSGEAGIGKTSLLQEFAANHTRSARVLWGGCEALFTPHPLAPFHDIARALDGDLGAVLSSGANRHEIFNATLEQLSRAEGPTLMIVEDAHWADEATLDLIKFLGRRLQRTRVLLVMSYRDDSVYDKHPLCSVIGDLPTASTTRISLSALSQGAVEKLAQAFGRDSANLYAATGGNPFFVTEVLATAGSHELPPTVRDAVIARMARLSDPARRIAYLVSIVPGKVERWLLEDTMAPDKNTLQECLNAGMLIYPDYALGFRHEIARRAVEDSIPLAERQGLNAAVLAKLMARGTDKVSIARLVHHADRAGDDAAVLRFAPDAAAQAVKVGAHREACTYLEIALRHGVELDPVIRAGLLERLSYGCYLTDRIEESLRRRDESLALWRTVGAPLKIGDNLRWLSRLHWFNGSRAEAQRHALEAVQTLEPLPAGRELAMAYSNLSQLYMLSYDTAPTLEWGHKALDLAVTLGDVEIQAHALNNIGTVKHADMDLSGLDDLKASLKISLENGFDEHTARAYVNLSSKDVRHRDHSPAAMRLIEEGLAYCDDRDLDSWSGYLQAYRSEARLWSGDWEGASHDADAIARCSASAPVIKIPALVTLGRLRARRGDPDMHTPLADAYRYAVPTGEIQRLSPALSGLAEAAWIHSLPVDDILPALQQAYELSLHRADPWDRAELAFWLWRLGRPSQTTVSLPEPYALQIAGDWQGAARAWETLGCSYAQAQALMDSDEENPLRQALDIFERLGATPLAAMLRRKLRASGVRGVPRGAQERTRQNPCGMTNKELKVLSLLVEGRRNADIARRLFISDKTVGHHVSAVLAKLGVHSRGEAAAAAQRLGFAPVDGDK